MKKLMFFAAMILTMGLVSCSSDDETMQGPIKVKLAPSKASKVTFYSNGNELDANGNVVGTNTNAKTAPFYVTRAEENGNPDAVEVNFSINERQYKSNDTKLSIHVRSVSDVTVFIPTPAEYYCSVDDMHIVQSHSQNVEAYGSNEHAEMVIDGNKVGLDIAFAENGITIKTSGMNENVQNYLQNKYHDGLTFEICNYFNTEKAVANGSTKAISKDELKSMLDDHTTISFTHTPAVFANAYGLLKGNATAGEKEVKIMEDDQEVTYHVRALDCKVVPADFTLFNTAVYGGVSGHTAYLYSYSRK